MHCKDVSMRDVDVPLDEDSIGDLMGSWTSYVRTDDLVLRNGDDYAVVELLKAPGNGLFRKVVGYRIVSLPGDTVFLDLPDLDVLNTPALAAVQAEHPGKAVVVRGMFSHINYIKDVVPQRLVVVDNVPPSPSKLGMADKLSEVGTDAVMFPCRVSNLSADIPYYFLDDAPEVDDEVTLIGCHLSKRIYTALYGGDVPFINVCPADYVDPSEKTIVKCCKVKTGHELDGNVVRVPWGATVPEVVEALNDLFGRS